MMMMSDQRGMKMILEMKVVVEEERRSKQDITAKGRVKPPTS